MATDLKPEHICLEANASWISRYVTPAGFICQITLRGENCKDLLEKTGLVLSYLAAHQYMPDTGFRKNGNGDGKLRPIHNSEMKCRERDGKSWFSHRLETGDWCFGKQRKN